MLVLGTAQGAPGRAQHTRPWSPHQGCQPVLSRLGPLDGPQGLRETWGCWQWVSRCLRATHRGGWAGLTPAAGPARLHVYTGATRVTTAPAGLPGGRALMCRTLCPVPQRQGTGPPDLCPPGHAEQVHSYTSWHPSPFPPVLSPWTHAAGGSGWMEAQASPPWPEACSVSVALATLCHVSL